MGREKMSRNSVANFWSRVDKHGPLHPKLGRCWLWLGAKNRKGYGQVGINGGYVAVHRFAYQQERGRIKKGLTLDHLCRVRNCVNPHHLEPVTNRENILRGEGIAARNYRKTHCKHGHEFTPENVYLFRGLRHCRACHKKYSLAYARKSRAA